MPIKQSLKRGLAFPTSTNINGEVLEAGLFVVNANGSIDTENFYGKFLLNPSVFEESKSANWVQHNVPGQSDPVVQWISSGARTITFDALVTTDKSPSPSNVSGQTAKTTLASAVKDYFANIAGSLAKVKDANTKILSAVTPENLDITRYLNYYRSLLHPEYSEQKGRRRLAKGPSRLVLLAGHAVSAGVYGERITNKNETWVLTELKIKTTKMLPNLSPMEAVVSFTLVLYNQESFSSDDYF